MFLFSASGCSLLRIWCLAWGAPVKKVSSFPVCCSDWAADGQQIQPGQGCCAHGAVGHSQVTADYQCRSQARHCELVSSNYCESALLGVADKKALDIAMSWIQYRYLH